MERISVCRESNGTSPRAWQIGAVKRACDKSVTFARVHIDSTDESDQGSCSLDAINDLRTQVVGFQADSVSRSLHRVSTEGEGNDDDDDVLAR